MKEKIKLGELVSLGEGYSRANVQTKHTEKNWVLSDNFQEIEYVYGQS